MTKNHAKFKLGQVVMTRGIADFLDEKPSRESAVIESIRQHVSGDWGDIPEVDKRENDEAIINGTRILSAYNIEDSRIWVITEADRSATTVLFPEEY